MPKDPRIKKVLVIGSGPIIIGQAAEFDYSGTQACRALKAEGIETVLLNSNPATIMTDPDVADHVYIEPMTLEVVERILDIEKPDSVLPNLGGQMGLNLSMELARSGYLDRTGIRLLACKPETIDRAEDRELFKETMEKLHQPIIPSEVVATLQDALACADRIGYPVIVRPAFTMGGTGGGICETREKLIEIGKMCIRDRAERAGQGLHGRARLLLHRSGHRRHPYRGSHRDLHIEAHSFPTRRSSDLVRRASPRSPSICWRPPAATSFPTLHRSSLVRTTSV